MAKYIEHEAIMQEFADFVKRSNNSDFVSSPTWNQAVHIVEDFPAADVVTRDCYDRILWENDIMRQQLADIGKAFAEKMDDVRPVVRCKDCEMANSCSDDRDMYCTLNHCYKEKNYFCADGKKREES